MEDVELTRNERELDRIGAFSDGVFAIAITLLVLNLAVPHVAAPRLGHALAGLKDDLIAYGIGFASMGAFWHGHYKLFSRLGRANDKLAFTNLLFLGTIALMPFTTGLIGRYSTALAVAIYAANVGAASFFDGFLEAVAVRGGLEAGVDESQWRKGIGGALARTIVFFVSIPIAYAVSPHVALWSWLLVLPLGTILARDRPKRG